MKENRKIARWVNSEYERQRMRGNTDSGLFEIVLDECMIHFGFFGETKETVRRNIKKEALELQNKKGVKSR